MHPLLHTLVVITGDLFKLVHLILRIYPLNPLRHRYWYLVVATEAGGTHPSGMLSCFNFITARKRSFAKVMFSQVSVCPQGWSLSRGWSLLRGVSIQRGLCPWGSLPMGVSAHGGFCRGGSLSSGFCLGGSLSSGFCLGGSLYGERGLLSRRPHHYGNVRVVRILLEYVLVSLMISSIPKLISTAT